MPCVWLFTEFFSFRYTNERLIDAADTLVGGWLSSVAEHARILHVLPLLHGWRSRVVHREFRLELGDSLVLKIKCFM